MVALTARPTTYRGIKMRSRLEAAYAQKLDTLERKPLWHYEPECFASADGQYLPDFHLDYCADPGCNVPDCEHPRGTQCYVEIKPEPILKDRDNLEATIRRMEVIWATHPDAKLLLEIGHSGIDKPIFATRIKAQGVNGRGVWHVWTPDIRIPMIWHRNADAESTVV